MKIKPCPFCGGSSIRVGEYTPECTSSRMYSVKCWDCWAGFEDMPSEQAAINKWNIRKNQS